MATFLFFVAIVIFLSASYADHTYRYNVAYPSSPFFLVRFGDDKREAKVLLDTNRPYTMVFDKVCGDKGFECTKNKHDYLYDYKKTNGKLTNKTLMDKYDYNRNFGGFLFTDVVRVDSIGCHTDVLVVDHGHPSYNFEWDGVLGLGISNGRTNIIKNIMTDISTAQIVIQEGKYNIPRKNAKNEMISKGSVVFGKLRGSTKCGPFTYVNATATSWQFRADVHIGNETLTNQKIGFVPGRPTQVPLSIYNELFSDKKATDESNFHEISFSVDGKTCGINKNDYLYYVEAGNYYEPIIDIAYPNYGYDFAFGSDFLQHYCVALRAHKSVVHYQIGFAENSARRICFATTLISSLVLGILRILV
ncbi:unnamed protein product [Bursaphelenchus xylophilus]|uniref:(pine wood nematode) hypothetical protein n=1 Tax=Bursaphelenchus xylophilus TaxID=6326 RepID=A0A1I7RTG9_BURXY|nr:unnamed protein product [Bursaphelenchus xylophilus]CAG9122454.1 unnamed protein product [Bursaphelenchus xylophilus]